MEESRLGEGDDGWCRPPERVMELCFFRHGDAEAAAGADEARELTERGRRESRAVGEALRGAGVSPGAILTSPLTRARQTGEILKGVFGVRAEAEERLGSGCGLGAIQDLVAERAQEQVMFVGHEPDMSRIVGELIGSARVRMKKSGCARVSCESVEPGGGTLIWLVSPELLFSE